MSMEARVLASVLAFGCLAVGVIWMLETVHRVIAPWDRWAYPILIALFVGSALSIVLRPAWLMATKAVVLATINVYLVGSVHQVLFGTGGPLDMYKMATAMFWLPLCYSGVFVFLPLRAALPAAVLTFLATFTPIGVAYLLGAPPRWGEGFATLAVNLALAQVTYFMMLSAVAVLRSDARRSEARADLMRTLAATDVLTGLPNRRSLSEAMTGHMALAERGAQALSVMLIDIDHFKRINDRHGHAAGDAVLVQLAQLLRAELRSSDLVGRWGGEEFLVVAPATSISTVADLAERLRERVAGWAFDHGQPMSISIGVSQALPGDTMDSLLQRADRALYRAKRRGRNCVEHQAVAVAS